MKKQIFTRKQLTVIYRALIIAGVAVLFYVPAHSEYLMACGVKESILTTILHGAFGALLAYIGVILRDRTLFIKNDGEDK